MIFTIALLFGCKKEENKAPTPAPTPTPTIVYTAADSAISGDWILDLEELYNSGVIFMSTAHTDPVNCHLNLQLIPYTTGDVTYKNCIYGLACHNGASAWRLNASGIDFVNAIFTIVSQSNTNLVLQYGSINTTPGSSAQKYYFHK